MEVNNEIYKCCREAALSLARWLGRQAEGHEASNGFPRAWREEHKPQASRNQAGEPIQGPPGVYLLQAVLALVPYPLESGSSRQSQLVSFKELGATRR